MRVLTSMQLDKAADLVCTHWFPYDKDVYTKALDCASSKKFLDENVCKENLLPILRSDASLYLLCLKEVQKNVRRVRLDETAFLSSIFESASLLEIKTALTNISKMLIPHELNEATLMQSKRLSEMLVASTTAEELSRSYQISKDVGYSAAIIRQLGYTLVAWNYPKIYTRITAKPSTKLEIDQEIRKYLGFSPSMLAYAVLEKLGLQDEYGALFQEEKTLPSSIVARIRKICEIGEALARATSPEVYKTAKADFAFAEENISNSLGATSLSEILSRAATGDVHASSDDLNLLFGENIERSIERSQHVRALRERNVYLRSLPHKEHDLSLKVYSKIDPSSVNKEALKVFTKELIPRTLFSATVVYLIDPIEESIYPSLIVGRPKKFQPKTISLRRPGSYELLVSSLKLVSPIKEDFSIGDANTTILVSSIGDPIVGVFYVEMDEFDDNLNVINYFKAIRNLFKDSLAI